MTHSVSMAIKHIFISHAAADIAVAKVLEEHLKNAGHETKVDIHELDLGDNTITFMNEGISNAHTVIVLFSKASATAKWQNLEINSALWNELEQDGGRCILIRLDDTKVPPLLGPKVYGKLDRDDPHSVADLVENVCNVILHEETASSVVAQAFRAHSRNPFRHLRAEYFERTPELHAKAFAPPDPLKMGSLEDMKPCFLEGSRGTGKSMLLLSLRARNRLQRATDNALPIFGFYVKLSRGALCNAGVVSDADWDSRAESTETSQISDIAAQEIMIQILESLVSEVYYCLNNKLIVCDPTHTQTLVHDLEYLIFDSENTLGGSFEKLHDKLGRSHKLIAEFIRRRFIYNEQSIVPEATFDLEQLKRALPLIRRHIPQLRESTFTILLDEYENLFAYQQRIVNSYVKLGPPNVSVKVAKKIASGDTASTTEGQELQETHDYTRLPLVYDVEDARERKDYLILLKHIVKNNLQSEDITVGDVRHLLPPSEGLEVPEEAVISEVAKLLKTTPNEFNTWPERKRREKWTYYRDAAIYRVLLSPKGKHPDKVFAGLEELAYISSGVIRYFQEILGVAYHLNGPTDGELVFPPKIQSQAVHFVSQHNLTTLSRNVERHGETLKYFLLDLGDCLRHKLRLHSSEPEAARLTIEDPERLESEDMNALKDLLVLGTKEGVLQTKEGIPAFKPKHHSDPQPAEFNISRLLAPVLGISPRLRWRTPVTCSVLQKLLLPGKRSTAVSQLKAGMIRSDRAQPTLRFSQEGEAQS